MYIYLPHLMALDFCKPVQDEPWHGESPDHHFPLQVEFWTKELHGDTDHYFTNYIQEGITNGFRIGSNRRHPLCSSIKILSTKNLGVITSYLEREVQLGRMHRHIGCPPGIHLSPIGAIPKKHKPGKWRLIMDLSFPAGSSINDGISY